MSSRDHQIYIHSHYVLSLGLRLCNYCCHSFIIQYVEQRSSDLHS
nr:MAG TPA: hypothetical protein [Caudoviricetes sp.]